MQHMYHENRKSINAFVGCKYNCVYCKPSFQAQMKRQKPQSNGRGCQKCYDYIPHTHLERLNHAPPKTKKDEFIFMPSSGDINFMRANDFAELLAYAERYQDRTFLIQTKDPFCLLERCTRFPKNVLLGTTIETNLLCFDQTRSLKYYYWDISQAPYPCTRKNAMAKLDHSRKTITIEPILDFTLEVMIEWMNLIKPEIIWVGYDNHNCRLPEPPLEKTQALIDGLRTEGFDVRLKSIRKAWYEQ